MSVINQVLNQLERRGAYSSSEQGTVRAVPEGKRKFAMPLLALVLALIVGVAAWQGLRAGKPVLSSVGGQNVLAGNAAPNIAADAGNSPGASELGKLTLQHQSEVVAAAPISGVLGEEPTAEVLATKSGNSSPVGSRTELNPPSSHLSFELSPVPPPSRLRDKPMPSVISSVSPDPVVAAGMPQPLVIKGSNFSRNSTVTLRTSTGQIYAKRPVNSQSATQIVINPNLGKSADTWTVEVIDSSGTSSGLFTFAVRAPAATAGQSVGRSDPIAKGNKAAIDTPAGGEGRSMKQVSPMQQAEAEYRKAAALMQQGRIAEAVAGYEAALRLDAGHDQARQALAALLLEGKHGADAERVLQEGLKNKPAHTAFAMLLARLQVERGAMDQALATMEKSLPYADTQADYQAFLAALLQRQNRHNEAIAHYQIVLQLAPNNGVWQMGYGISLQAVQRNAEAKEAYQRALNTQTLSPDLQAIVQKKLNGL